MMEIRHGWRTSSRTAHAPLHPGAASHSFPSLYRRKDRRCESIPGIPAGSCPWSMPRAASSRPAAPTPTERCHAKRPADAADGRTGAPGSLPSLLRRSKCDNWQNQAFIEMWQDRRSKFSTRTDGLPAASVQKEDRWVQGGGRRQSCRYGEGEIFGDHRRVRLRQVHPGPAPDPDLEEPTARRRAHRRRVHPGADPARDPKQFRRMVQIGVPEPLRHLSTPRDTIEQIMLRPPGASTDMGGNEEERPAADIRRSGWRTAACGPRRTFWAAIPTSCPAASCSASPFMRAMCVKPRFILVVDEPVSMLDVSVRADIINMLLDTEPRSTTTAMACSSATISPSSAMWL